MNSSSKTFFANLDGLRFFAFLLVFVTHAISYLGYHSTSKNYEFVKTNFLKNGDIGVNIFFVLSGFLITFLLLKEKETTGKINMLNFYIRRVLRIFPVYFIVVALCLLFFPLLNNHLPPGFPFGVSIAKLNPVLYLTFLGNFDYLWHGITNVLIGPLWSVSVEEQFYLLWCPLIFILPRKFLLPLFISVIAVSVGYRYFFSNGNSMNLKYHSLSCMLYLATGALIAELSMKEKIAMFINRIPKYTIIIIYILGFASLPFRLFIWKLGIHYVLAASIIPIVFAMFFAFIILEQNYSEHSFYKFSKSKIISSFGKYTYGMYCYHLPVICCLLFSLQFFGANIRNVNVYSFVSLFITALFATFTVSMLSYHFIESFFLKLKERF